MPIQYSNIAHVRFRRTVNETGWWRRDGTNFSAERIMIDADLNDVITNIRMLPCIGMSDDPVGADGGDASGPCRPLFWTGHLPRFIDSYTESRLHSALGYLSPNRFEEEQSCEPVKLGTCNCQVT